MLNQRDELVCVCERTALMQAAHDHKQPVRVEQQTGVGGVKLRSLLFVPATGRTAWKRRSAPGRMR
jgi:hypothetical protein